MFDVLSLTLPLLLIWVPRRAPTFEVGADHIRISYGLGGEAIALSGITAVTRLPRELWDQLRRADHHGVDSRLGYVTVHATRPGELVAIDTDLARSVHVERRAAGDVVIPLAGLRAASRVDADAVWDARYLNGVPIMLVRDVANAIVASPRLGRFRLFAWRDGPYVRLDLPDLQVVLTPDDPDRFVAEVRAAAAR